MTDLYNVDLGADSDDDDAPSSAASGMRLKRLGAGAAAPQRAPLQRPATGLMRRSGHGSGSTNSTGKNMAPVPKQGPTPSVVKAPADSDDASSTDNRRDSGGILFFDEGVQQVRHTIIRSSLFLALVP